MLCIFPLIYLPLPFWRTTLQPLLHSYQLVVDECIFPPLRLLDACGPRLQEILILQHRELEAPQQAFLLKSLHLFRTILLGKFQKHAGFLRAVLLRDVFPCLGKVDS